MAVNTSIGFAALGTGIVASALRYAAKGHNGPPRWLALAGGCAGFTITLSLAFALTSEFKSRADAAFQLALGANATDTAVAALRQNERSILPIIVVVVGGLVSVLLVLMVNLALTASERAEAARLLSSIVESSGDSILSTDRNGIVSSWNQGAERMFGYTAAEIVGRSSSIILPLRVRAFRYAF